MVTRVRGGFCLLAYTLWYVYPIVLFTHRWPKCKVNDKKLKDTETEYRIHSAFNAAILSEGLIESRTSPL